MKNKKKIIEKLKKNIDSDCYYIYILLFYINCFPPKTNLYQRAL